MVSLGYTAEPSRYPATDDAAKAIFEGVVDLIIENRDNVDYAGNWDFYVDSSETPEGEEEEALRTALVQRLTGAVAWMRDNGREQSFFEVPGLQYPNFMFVTSGGMTWGDDPFDEFSDVCNLLAVVDALPQIGKSIGVLGGGIKTEYTLPSL